MESITITFITLIMAIFASTKTVINRYLKFSMCVITTYFLLNFKYNKGIVLWLYDYQWNIESFRDMFNNGIVFWWIIFMLLTYLFFYNIIPYVLRTISNRLINNYIEEKINKFEDSQLFKRWVSYSVYKILKKLLGSKNVNSINSNDINSFISEVNLFASYLLHFLICWILLDINNSPYILLLIITAILLAIFFRIVTYPLIYKFKILNLKDEPNTTT